MLKRGAGWACIAAFVIAYDMTAEETLSSCFRRHRTNPVVIAIWGSLTLHLFGALPPKYDPYRFAHKRRTV
jgi:hypothetical protein